MTRASSFDEAIKLLREFDFDCMTLDLSLGERSGVELLYRLSEMNCQTPIIIISASERAVCEETVRVGENLNLNLCELIVKPIDLAFLRETLRRVAIGNRQRQVLEADGR